MYPYWTVEIKDQTLCYIQAVLDLHSQQKDNPLPDNKILS